MDGLYGILQTIWQGIVRFLGGLWTGWQGIIDWVTQVAVRQIGMTMHETSDVVNYVSGVIAIIAAVLTIYRIVKPPTDNPTPTKVLQFYERINEQITLLIIALRHKHVDEANQYYYACMAELHKSKYLLDTNNRNEIFMYWTPAKQEYQSLYKAIRKGERGRAHTIKLEELQQHVQQRLSMLK